MRTSDDYPHKKCIFIKIITVKKCLISILAIINVERKIERSLKEWKDDPRRKPLIVTGCRRIGKTHAVRGFLESSYDSYIEVDLENEPESRRIFEGSLDAGTIVDKLVIASGVKLTPGRSAIFLDEIQASPGAFSCLKWLAEDGRFDVIATASFLGMTFRDDPPAKGEHVPISPLGYVDLLAMHPMDFEEYLWAMKVDKRIILHAREAIRNRTPVDEFFHGMLREHFLRYLIVGGMPEAVETYARSRDYVETKRVLKDILGTVWEDAGRYSERKTDRRKILACLESMPSQLASGKRKFQFRDIEGSGGGERRYGYALGWLVETGIAYISWNLVRAESPLSVNMKTSSFRMYVFDTGLMTVLSEDIDPGAVVNVDPFSGEGVVMEDAVASALAKKGYRLYHYAKENSTLDIGFVIGGSQIGLIDVVSGRNRRSRSLDTMLARDGGGYEGFRICDGNLSIDGNGAVRLPIYGVCFLPEFAITNVPTVEEVMGEVKYKEPGDR